MLHFISNVIVFVIWKKTLRDKIRVMIRYPRTLKYIRFVYQYPCNIKKRKISVHVGRGCRNFVVILNSKYVFKFPLFDNGKDVSLREMRIIDTFSKISPIKIPKMEIIHFGDIYVRKYEYANGELLSDVKPEIVCAHREHIAKQIAAFMYSIGVCDPVEIQDLKADKNEQPGFLYGWFHGDIWQNFMLNTKTFDITYFIDWEDTKFQSFVPGLHVATRTWEKRGYRYLGIDVLCEYSKLYLKGISDCSPRKK
ncbi:MAG: hypothetical protein MJ187_00135 [Alphaproteobacteria bacterium]|nr:hypothetical protein [Alphaproteobacteria bacterium]